MFIIKLCPFTIIIILIFTTVLIMSSVVGDVGLGSYYYQVLGRYYYLLAQCILYSIRGKINMTDAGVDVCTKCTFVLDSECNTVNFPFPDRQVLRFFLNLLTVTKYLARPRVEPTTSGSAVVHTSHNNEAVDITGTANLKGKHFAPLDTLNNIIKKC